MNTLMFAWHNIGRNRRRSLVAILIAAIGTCGILLTFGYALYVYDSLEQFSIRDNGNLIISHADFFELQEETPMEFGLSDEQTPRRQLMQDNRIKQVLPEIKFSGLITNGTKSSVFIGNGISAERYGLLGPTLDVIEGNVLSRNPNTQEAEIVLGNKLARQLHVHPGDGVTLLATTVDGVLNAIDVIVAGTVSTGVPDIDERLVNVHLQTAQQLLMTEKVSTLSVYCYERVDEAALTALINQRWPQLQVTSWQQRAFFYHGVRDLYNRIFGGMGIIIVCLVLFAVVNTISMTVVERTREIGALSAMGTYRYEILNTFILEGGLLGGIGAMIGTFMALLISLALLVIKIQMPPPPGQTNGYPLEIYFSLQISMVLGLIMVVLAAVAAGFAAFKGVRKPIVEALAHV